MYLTAKDKQIRHLIFSVFFSNFKVNTSLKGVDIVAFASSQFPRLIE